MKHINGSYRYDYGCFSHFDGPNSLFWNLLHFHPSTNYRLTILQDAGYNHPYLASLGLKPIDIFSHELIGTKVYHEVLSDMEEIFKIKYEVASKIVDCTHPVFKYKAAKIKSNEFGTEYVEQIINAMEFVAYEGQTEGYSNPRLVGLSATQLGYGARICMVDTKASGKGSPGAARKLLTLYNPHITKLSGRRMKNFEGCRTTGRVCGVVSRYMHVEVAYQDKFGHKKEITLEGFPATIIQHEVDHLNGIFFVDHIQSQEDLHVVFPAEFGGNGPFGYGKNYREGWKDWPRLYPIEAWQEFRKYIPKATSIRSIPMVPFSLEAYQKYITRPTLTKKAEEISQKLISDMHAKSFRRKGFISSLNPETDLTSKPFAGLFLDQYSIIKYAT